jgi:hypothetical protein
VAWSVDVSWTDIRFLTQITRLQNRRAKARREREQAKVEGKTERRGGSWIDALSAAPSDFGDVLVLGVVVLVVILLVLAFPWLLVLFLDIAELLVFPLIAIVVIGWRVARRRPFPITAMRDHEPVARWRVVGVRDARRVERAIADAIVAGGDPVVLFPEYFDRY